VRSFMLLALLAVSCGGPATAAPTVTPGATPSTAAPPAATAAATCEATTSRDATGVITVDGHTGIVGSTSTFGEDTSGSFWIVRRGAALGDQLSLTFRNRGSSAPASWVAYGVSATARPTPWGEVAFQAGWKPIAFANSCWALVVNGAETGLVLAVGP